MTILNQITTTLETVQKGVRARTLAEGDAKRVLAILAYARRYARRHGVDPLTVRVTTHGGYVVNSYRYPADCTYLAASGDGTFNAYRAQTSSRSHGVGVDYRVEMPAPEGDERRGRDLPRFAPTGRKSHQDWRHTSDGDTWRFTY